MPTYQIVFSHHKKYSEKNLHRNPMQFFKFQNQPHMWKRQAYEQSQGRCTIFYNLSKKEAMLSY